MLRSCFLLLCAISTLAGHAQLQDPSVPTWIRWQGPEFSLEHPTHWSVAKPTPFRAVVVFQTAQAAGDPFQENLNVMIQELGVMGLADFAALTEEQVRTQLPEGRLISSAPGRDVQGAFHTLEYTGSMDGQPLHWLQSIRMRDGKTYTMTVTAHEDVWQATRPIAQRALASFAWVKK